MGALVGSNGVRAPLSGDIDLGMPIDPLPDGGFLVRPGSGGPLSPHASTHADGGSDEISISASQITAGLFATMVKLGL